MDNVARLPQELPAASDVHLVVVSDDPRFARQLDASFNIRRLTVKEALVTATHFNEQVVLLDARARQRQLEASRLAMGGTRTVIVFGPTRDVSQAMRYLDLGAADYVSRMMSQSEIDARIRAAARYSRGESDDWIHVGDIAVSLRRQEVHRHGEPVRLTPNEFRLLAALLEERGDTVTHRELIARVWGPDLLSAKHYLRVYIRQLREKLEPNPSQPRIIQTVRGGGYRLALPAPLVMPGSKLA